MSPGSTGTARLNDDRPAVDLGPHEVNRAAGEAHAGLDGPGMGIQPLERGQQRGMNVDQPVVPAFHEFRREHAHEAGEADQLDAACFQRLRQRPFEGSPRPVPPVVDDPMGQARLCGPREAVGVCPVGEHQRDFARGAGAGAVVDESLKIGAATRDQDTHLQPRHVAPNPSAAAVPEPAPVALPRTP